MIQGDRRAAGEIDILIGARVKQRRKLLGQSQLDLADACGITFQQIQKYERGVNRISASMLSRIAALQGVAPGWYFDGLDAVVEAGRDLTDEQRQVQAWLRGPEAIQIGQAFVRLKPDTKAALIRMARALCDLD